MIRANRLAKALAAAAALGMFGASQAQTTINNGLTPGAQNLVSDESRETYVDANRNGLFDTGDVIFGYIQIQNFSPSGALAGNAVYGVFSQQVTSITGTTNINFGATTVAGLTLQALTGNAAAPAGSIASFYDNAAGYGTNLITTALGGATSMKDYIDFITGNGTLRLTAGLSRPSDFLVSGSNFAGAPNSNFINLPSGIQVAATGGGLSVVQNNTNFSYAANVSVSSPIGMPHLSSITSRNCQSPKGLCRVAVSRPRFRRIGSTRTMAPSISSSAAPEPEPTSHAGSSTRTTSAWHRSAFPSRGHFCS